MKARIKETGEIIDVECRFYAKIGSTDPIIHNSLVEVLKDDEIIDWEQRRYELAKAAMQGVLSNPAFCGTYSKREAPIIIALDCADNMIKKTERGITMDIEEVKNKKSKAEMEIAHILEKLEAEIGLEVNNMIYIRRESEKSTLSALPVRIKTNIILTF